MSVFTEIRDVDGDTKNLKLMKQVDKRVDCVENNENDSLYVGYVGAQYWNSYAHPATVYTPNEIQFTGIKTPGYSLLVDKKWWLDYTIKITFKNIPGTKNMPNTFFCDDPPLFLRPYPIHQTTNTIQVKLNNRDIQSYPMENLNVRMEYWPQDYLKLSCGCCPHRKYNGQTLSDCEMRKGNAPYGNLNEFTDQDYPNSTLIDIIDISQVNPVVDADSDFERDAPFKAYKLQATNDAATTGVTPQKYGAINCTNSATANLVWEASPGTDAAKIMNNVKIIMYRYLRMQQKFAEFLADKNNGYNGVCTIGSIMTAKKKFLAQSDIINLLGQDPKDGITKGASEYSFAAPTSSHIWLDVDFLSAKDVSALQDLKVICEYRNSDTNERTGTVKTFWSGALCTQMGSFSMTVRIREPIIAEPLDYTSSSEFGRTFWNLYGIELKYTFNNHLKNMLAVDEMKLQKNFEWYWAYEVIKGLYEGKEQGLISDENVDIQFTEPPRLRFNIATPFKPPEIGFMCAIKQFQRYESHLSTALNKEYIDRSDYIKCYGAKKITAVSDAYPLQFHPNAVYIWVGERNLDRYSSPNRYYHIDSYAKISGLRITYGNTSNIMAQFDDHELFLMSLRNGLQDRSYLDWNAIPKTICTSTEYDGYKNFFGYGGDSLKYTVTYGTGNKVTGLNYDVTDCTSYITYKRYAGIGSVLKLIPGIDILSGDKTNPLIGGMPCGSMTIKIEADFIPLNINQSINYSLYVMFEYDGVCTISCGKDHQCDLGMVAIQNWDQLANAPKIRTPRELTNYDRGLGGRGLDQARMYQCVSKQLRPRATGSGLIGGGSGGSAPKMSGGKLIDPKDLNGGKFYSPY